MPFDFDTILLVFVLCSGFYMAWSIGANDVANAMGTSVGSGALTLRRAVVIAAVLEFSGAFFFGSYVSETMQSGLVNYSIFNGEYHLLVYGMLAALLASGAWLQLASYYGWPVSTTHSIVGAIVGFGIVAGGFEAIQWSTLGTVVASWIISPLIGGIISYTIFNALRKQIFFTRNPVDAAIKLTPFLVFGVFAILVLILLWKGIHSALDTTDIIFISAGVGLLASLISWFLVRRIKLPDSTANVSDKTYSPEIGTEFSKAKKHLDRILHAADKELHYRTQLLIEEVDHLTYTYSKKPEVDSSQFKTVEKIFGYLQILSACLMAFAHGANDVSNAIGPLGAAVHALKTQSVTPQSFVSPWLLALGGLGIVLGLAMWGWRVMETIGKKITELTPTRGFAAEFGAAVTILLASRLGLPVSTTHTLVGAVLGVGFARGLEALDMSTTRNIILSWVITVPAGALGAMIIYSGLKLILGVS